MARSVKHDTFAARLRSLMEQAGVTAYRLAQLSGVSQQSLSAYLAGTRRPSLDAARKLCKALGASLAHFD